MHKAILGMGTHIRDARQLSVTALNRFALTDRNDISQIIIAGLGGSAIGGDILRSYINDTVSIPVFVNRTYHLPKFTGKHTLVILSSYSGDTEETLSMFEDAVSAHAQIICMTTGGKLQRLAESNGYPVVLLPKGFQPRAALAYSFIPLLTILERFQVLGDMSQDIESAANIIDECAKTYSHENPHNTAITLASQLLPKIPVIYSSQDIYDTVNLRWRGQIQENAKHAAFGNILPEMNHNEINGWEKPHSLKDSFLVIFLRSVKDEHHRVSKRFDILREVLTEKGIAVIDCNAVGDTRLARMFSLIALGDWVSYYLALLEGVDPSPVPVISFLKKKLES
jgi:glucose/mannose-6-phosphate isomerase